VTLGVGILLAIATAFLAAALGAYATGADEATLAAFVAVSIIGTVAAVAWSSDDFRRWLPVAKPFHMRCHALWAEGETLRHEARNLGHNDAVPDDLYEKVVDWDRRVWDTLLGEMSEAANIEEKRHGGRLANRSRDTAYAISTRIGQTRTLLEKLIEERQRA
jgi:hypothetical protein